MVNYFILHTIVYNQRTKEPIIQKVALFQLVKKTWLHDLIHNRNFIKTFSDIIMPPQKLGQSQNYIHNSKSCTIKSTILLVINITSK